MYFVSTIIFSLLLIQLHTILIRGFIVISLLLCIFVYPVHQVYGEIDFLYLVSVFYTTYDESVSYIKVIPIGTFVTLIVFSVFSFWLLGQDFYRFKNRKIIYFLLGVLLILPVKRVLKDSNKPLDDYSNVLPLKKLIFITENFIKIRKEHYFIEGELRKNDTWGIIRKDISKMKKNMIIVIGESVRRDMLHTYGFPINNTNFIDSSSNIIFDNYISVGWTTVQSLRPTLSVSDGFLNYQLNNNIITLGKKLGYETYWISNQRALGEFDSPIAVMGKMAKESHFFNGKIEDNEMLPIINTILNKEDKPKLIVIHMAGSHPRICDITKGKYDEYIISDEISCYNKTIRDLDNFLKNINHSLYQQKESFGLVYFSDHGLWINPNLQLSHSLFQENFNVPFFLWADDITTSKTISASRSGGDFLHFFTEFLGVKTKNINRNYRFISEENTEKIKVLKNEKDLIDYDQLKYNTIPYK